MLFSEIVMINYSRPLAARLEARKHCGPYRWTPTEPGKGRGFYSGKYATEVDSHGSSFDLRLDYANNHLPAYNRGLNGAGYCCDDLGGDMLQPIIARLPHGRGFLAGWTMGEGMCGTLDATIHDSERDAALAAHFLAESDATVEREYQAEERERIEAEEAAELAAEEFAESCYAARPDLSPCASMSR